MYIIYQGDPEETWVVSRSRYEHDICSTLSQEPNLVSLLVALPLGRDSGQVVVIDYHGREAVLFTIIDSGQVYTHYAGLRSFIA